MDSGRLSELQCVAGFIKANRGQRSEVRGVKHLTRLTPSAVCRQDVRSLSRSVSLRLVYILQMSVSNCVSAGLPGFGVSSPLTPSVSSCS